MIGRIGPKISSAITGSSGAGSTITVASMLSVERSEPPPATTLPAVVASSETSRSNWRSLTIRSESVVWSARNLAMVATIFSVSSRAIARSART